MFRKSPCKWAVGRVRPDPRKTPAVSFHHNNRRHYFPPIVLVTSHSITVMKMCITDGISLLIPLISIVFLCVLVFMDYRRRRRRRDIALLTTEGESFVTGGGGGVNLAWRRAKTGPSAGTTWLYYSPFSLTALFQSMLYLLLSNP